MGILLKAEFSGLGGWHWRKKLIDIEVQIENSLNSGSSEGDDRVFDLGGIVGSTPPWLPPSQSWNRTI